MNSDRQTENSEQGSIPLLDESDSDLLFCQQERLDQNSPELWPETMPGVNEFTSSALFSSPPKPALNTVSFIVVINIFHFICGIFNFICIRHINMWKYKNTS